MLRKKHIGIFISGWVCGLVVQWMPSSSSIALGDGGNSSAGRNDSTPAPDPAPPPPGLVGGSCLGDIAPQPNGDGVVNVDDLLVVIGNWS